MNRALNFFITILLVGCAWLGLSNCSQAQDLNSSHWRIKNTAHFQIMYQDDYMDAEAIYQDLAEELDLTLKCSSPKTKVIIQPGRAYVDLTKRKMVVANAIQLRHELTHLLFYQLSPTAPLSLQEGIARFKENNYYPHNIKVELAEFLKLASTSPKRLNFTDLNKLRLYQVSQAWVGRVVSEQGMEKFKQFYRLCTHPSKIASAYERVYQQ